MQIYVDERVVLWKRTTINIPDNVSIDSVVQEIEEQGDAWCYCDKHDPAYNDVVDYPINDPDVEYLLDTEEDYGQETIGDITTEVYEVCPKQDKLIASW